MRVLKDLQTIEFIYRRILLIALKNTEKTNIFCSIGIGDGVGSVLFAQIIRTSTVEERTSVLSMALAARQIGLVLG